MATKQRIERAALQLFADRGVEQTTTRDIAAGAGISEGAIYRHFQSKEALVHELFAANYLRLTGEVEALQARETHLRGKLAVMVGAFCQLFEDDPYMFRFLLLVQHGELQKMSKDARTAVKVLHEVIEAAVVRGEVPAQDAGLAAAMVFGLVLQPALFKIYGVIDAPMTALAPRLAEACWQSLSKLPEARS